MTKRFTVILLLFMIVVAASVEGKADVPEIPETGSIVPLSDAFPHLKKGEKYAVWSGPGENYVREANGKALVSTNDRVWILGMDGEWLLIMYEYAPDSFRFGYIKNTAVQNQDNIPLLDFSSSLAFIVNRQTPLTSDPLGNKSAVAFISVGTEVHTLGMLGSEWTYVEAITNLGLMRGFIPKGD